MKTVNKYLFLLAAAVFGLTACEKQQEREPSPEGNPNAVAFSQSKFSGEFNPSKVALEYEIKVGRSVANEALTVNFDVEGDVDIIKVPTSVSFAAGEKEVPLKLTFPNAEVDSTYSVILTVKEDNKSPYVSGATTFEFTAIIAAWEPAQTKAIVFDGIVGSMYSVSQYGWYVSYLEKINTDGSFDIRLLNPYASAASGDEDQFGIFDGYPYNAPEEVLSGTFNWDLHIAADGQVTFDSFKMGMLWSADYGEFLAGLTEGAAGTYDAATKTISFAPGAVWGTMANLTKTYTWDAAGVIIYLDAAAYQNDHLSISDFNASDIAWEEQESVVNVFESTIFSFTNEDQKLFKAVDPYPENPKSPFINLWSLKDAYAAGGNLAFYWNGEDGDLNIPTPQNTKLSFMQKDLYIVEAAGAVETKQVKGTDVKVFTFDIIVASADGNLVGEFVETFSVAEQAIIFEKSDFVGNFTLAGYSPFDGTEDVRAIEIQEVEGELVILGLDYCESIKTSFDAETGVLSIAPQALPGKFSYQGNEYDLALYTMDGNGNPGATAVIDLAFKLDGAAHITPTSTGVGYLARAEGLGWLDGVAEFDMTPAAAAPEAAPRHAPAINGARSFKSYKVHMSSKPSVNGLSFQGKYRPSLKKNLNLMK